VACDTVQRWPNVVSISYSLDESTMTIKDARRQCSGYGMLGMMGTTVVHASGDFGVAGIRNVCLDANGRCGHGCAHRHVSWHHNPLQVNRSKEAVSSTPASHHHVVSLLLLEQRKSIRAQPCTTPRAPASDALSAVVALAIYFPC